MNNMSNGSLNGNHYGTLLLLLVISAFFIRYVLASGQIIAPDGILYIEVAKDVLAGISKPFRVWFF